MFVEKFPLTRLRRLRRTDWIRELVTETRITPADLIQPIFVTEGVARREPIASLPGIDRISVDIVGDYAERVYNAGVRCVMVLPCIADDKKSEDAAEAFNEGGLLSLAVREIKRRCPNLGIMGDIALDLYTSHGHDGILDFASGEILNDETVEALVKQSLVQANMGVDILCPSDMMDGRVQAIRHALEQNGHLNTMIFPHSAKYASALYGPYRGAVRSDKNLGKRDKRTYQQNPANAEEALREVRLDISEGADGVIAKPGTLYLDIIHNIRREFGVPVVAFHVSGEYAMLKAGAAAGFIDEKAVLLETILSFKRAGSSAVITYAALEVAEQLSRS